MTMSFGVAASARGEAFDYEPLFEKADAALYQAKQGGRDQVCVFGREAATERAPARRPRRAPRPHLPPARRQALLAGERLAARGGDPHVGQLAGAASPVKFTTLLWRVRPAQALGVGARGAFDEDLERAPHEPLGALERAALDELHAAAPSAPP